MADQSRSILRCSQQRTVGCLVTDCQSQQCSSPWFSPWPNHGMSAIFVGSYQWLHLRRVVVTLCTNQNHNPPQLSWITIVIRLMCIWPSHCDVYTDLRLLRTMTQMTMTAVTMMTNRMRKPPTPAATPTIKGRLRPPSPPSSLTQNSSMDVVAARITLLIFNNPVIIFKYIVCA